MDAPAPRITASVDKEATGGAGAAASRCELFLRHPGLGERALAIRIGTPHGARFCIDRNVLRSSRGCEVARSLGTIRGYAHHGHLVRTRTEDELALWIKGDLIDLRSDRHRSHHLAAGRVDDR